MTHEENKAFLALQLENLALKHALVTRDMAELDKALVAEAEASKPDLRPVANSD